MADGDSKPEPGGRPLGHSDKTLDRTPTVVIKGSTTNKAQDRADELEADVRRKSGRLGTPDDYLAAAAMLDPNNQLSEQELERIERVAGMHTRDFVGYVYAKMTPEQRKWLLETVIPPGDEPLPTTVQNEKLRSLFRELRYFPAGNDEQDPQYLFAVSIDNREIMHLLRKPTFRQTPAGGSPHAPTIEPMSTSTLLAALATIEEDTNPSDDGNGDENMAETTSEHGASTGPGNGVGAEFASHADKVARLTPDEVTKVSAVNHLLGILADKGLLAPRDVRDLKIMVLWDLTTITGDVRIQIMARAKAKYPEAFEAAMKEFDPEFDSTRIRLTGTARENDQAMEDQLILARFGRRIGHLATENLLPSGVRTELLDVLTSAHAPVQRERDVIARCIEVGDEDAIKAALKAFEKEHPDLEPLDRPGDTSKAPVLLDKSPDGSKDASAAVPASEAEAVALTLASRSGLDEEEGYPPEAEPVVADEAVFGSQAVSAGVPDEVDIGDDDPIILQEDPEGSGRVIRKPNVSAPVVPPIPLPKLEPRKERKSVRLNDEAPLDDLDAPPAPQPEVVAPNPAPAKPWWLRRIVWLGTLLVILLLALCLYLMRSSGSTAVESTDQTQPVVNGPLTMAQPTEAFKVGDGWALHLRLTSTVRQTLNIDDDLDSPCEIKFEKKEGETKIRLVNITSTVTTANKIHLLLTITAPANGMVDGELVDLNQLHLCPFFTPQ